MRPTDRDALAAFLEREAEQGRELPIDAFGALPHQASRLPGLGGHEPPPDPAYVFRTLNVRPALGRITFKLHFYDLVATRGTLIVRVTAAADFPGMPSVAVRTVTTPLAELALENGDIHVEVTSRRNMVYAIEGEIHDETDAHALGISVILDRREPLASEAQGLRRTAGGEAAPLAARQLIATERATLARPVCQGFTEAQCGERVFAAWAQALGETPRVDEGLWRQVYACRALDSFGTVEEGTRGIVFGAGSGAIPALLAAEGATVLVVTATDGPDPGVALKALERPAICDVEPFHDRVHCGAFDQDALPPTLTGFDFAVSLDARARSATDERPFIAAAIRCLTPGGLLVHLTELGGDGLTRSQVEREVLELLSQGHDVAQLALGAGEYGPGRRPFGLIARRGK